MRAMPPGTAWSSSTAVSAVDWTSGKATWNSPGIVPRRTGCIVRFCLHRTTAHALEILPQLQVSCAPDQRFQAVLELPLIRVQHLRNNKAPLNKEKPLCKPTHGSM